MPDQYLAASGLATVNTALIECSPTVGNGFLSAIVWGSPTATDLYIRHTNGQSVIIPITNAAPSSKPDVILADDHANPGLDYIAVICFQDNNGDIRLQNYRISNITSTMIATQIGAYNLNAGNTPKIDGFANNTSLIAGKPEMDQFVVVWNLTTLNDIGVYAADVNDITLSAYSNTFTNAGKNPDVAAIRNIANNHLYADVVCYHGTYPTYKVYDIDITTATSPVITNLSTSDYPRPRIEGMGLYDPGMNPPKWGVVVLNDYTSVRFYSDLNPTNPKTVLLSASQLPSSNNYTAAITAGIGPFLPPASPSNLPIGNRQYTTCWGAGHTANPGAPPGIVSAAFDRFPNLITSPVTCAEVNNIPVGMVGQTIDDYEVGITSSCNSGNRLLSAWWNNAAGTIFYKLTPNNQYQFKPTEINSDEQKIVGFTVYPNPAKNSIWLKCNDLNIKTIQILNSFGKVEMKGLDVHSSIDISGLPSGNYFININSTTGQSLTQPFVKL